MPPKPLKSKKINPTSRNRVNINLLKTILQYLSLPMLDDFPASEIDNVATKIFINLDNTKLSINEINNLSTENVILLEEALNYLLNALNSFKESEKHIVLEFSVYLVVHLLLQKATKISASFILGKRYEESLKLSAVITNIYAFLQANCYLQHNGTSLKTIEFFTEIEDGYFSMGNCHLELNQLEKAKEYFKKSKDLIKLLPNNAPGKIPLSYQGYYFGMAQLALKANDPITARHYALKVQDHIHEDRDRLPINEAYLAFCKKVMMDYDYKKKKYMTALKWLKLFKEGASLNLAVYTDWAKGKTILGFAATLDPEKAKEEAIKNLKFCNVVEKQLKQKIIDKKLEKFKLGTAPVIKIIKQYSLKQTVLAIEFINDKYMASLLKSCRLNNIVCSANGSTLNIHYLTHVSVGRLIYIMENWRQQSDAIEMAENNKKLNLVTSIDINKPTLELAASIKQEPPLSNFITAPKEKQKTHPANNHTNYTNNMNALFTKSEAKVIKWGEGYPVYNSKDKNRSVHEVTGSNAKNHYIYIDPDFLISLIDHNLIMAKNLISICERGKSLGDSVRGKGIIIGDKENFHPPKKTAKKFKSNSNNQPMVKVKDSSKDYSFWGNVVTQVTINGQTYNLIKISGLQETHNSSIDWNLGKKNNNYKKL